MAPYVMQININNQTDHTLKYLGAAFYNGYGSVQHQGSDIPPQSSGDGGALQKSGGTAGLFGLVAYSCPDPNRMLIIYITMPSTTSTLNHCFVAVAPANTEVNEKLGGEAYNLSLNYETEGVMNCPFTNSGKTFSMQVIPKVNDQYAINTYTNVQISLTESS